MKWTFGESLKPQDRKLIINLSILLVIGFLTTSLLSFFVSRRALRHQIHDSSLPLTSDNIYSEIQRDLLMPIFISSMMANDTFLKDWIKEGEVDDRKITRYLNQIQMKYQTYTSFFVSEKSRKYYHTDGILKKVREDEPRDAWYFRVRKMKSDYEINVDPDMANADAMTIFINHSVYDDGTYIGVTGVGLTINSVVDLIDKYSRKYNRIIFFTDSLGHIILQGHASVIDSETIHDINGLSQYTDLILNSENNRITYTLHNQKVFLNTRFISELNYYLIVMQSEARILSGIKSTLLLNISFSVAMIVLIIIFSVITVNKYQKLNNGQRDEIINQHQELEKKNAALAEAVSQKTVALKNNELLFKEMSHRVKNNLAVIQSLLRIQSRKTVDPHSQQTLKESESRINSISKLHQLLSNSNDLRHIDTKEYLHELLNELKTSYYSEDKVIDIVETVHPLTLDLDKVIPLGLILNELITNAYKYAFLNRRQGSLKVNFILLEDSRVELTVQDDGIGLPDDFKMSQKGSLGMQIITDLTRQMDGIIQYESKHETGSLFRITFNV